MANDIVFLVYKITGKCGRGYVGITRTSMKDRWGAHVRAARNGEKSLFWDYLREKGKDWFSLEVLTECYSAREAIACERAMIAVHNTYYKQGGLNRNLGGGGNIGGETSPEVRAKISLANKIRMNANDEIRNAFANRYKEMGRPVSEEGKKKKAEGRKHAYTPERVAARAEKLKALHADPERHAELLHRQWATLQYEKALAARIGRDRPGRFHPSYANKEWFRSGNHPGNKVT